MKNFIKIAMIFLILSLPTPISAFDEKGISASLGHKSAQDNTVIGWRSDCHDFNWNSIGLFGRDNYDLWYIDYELDIGYLSWSAANSEEKNGETASSEFRAMFMRNFHKFHAGFGIGFALLSDIDEIIHLAENGYYGLLTGRIRLPFGDRYGVDFEGDHISAIFANDFGMNTWKVRFYVLF